MKEEKEEEEINLKVKVEVQGMKVVGKVRLGRKPLGT